MDAPRSRVWRVTVANSVEVNGPPGEGWHAEVLSDEPGTPASVEVHGGFNGGYLASASDSGVSTFQGPSLVRLTLSTGGPTSCRVKMERY